MPSISFRRARNSCSVSLSLFKRRLSPSEHDLIGPSLSLDTSVFLRLATRAARSLLPGSLAPPMPAQCILFCTSAFSSFFSPFLPSPITLRCFSLNSFSRDSRESPLFRLDCGCRRKSIASRTCSMCVCVCVCICVYMYTSRWTMLSVSAVGDGPIDTRLGSTVPCEVVRLDDAFTPMEDRDEARQRGRD